MNLHEIKEAVLAGKTVHWSNALYTVIYSEPIDEFLIKCSSNDTCIGLTWKDEVTMNGKEEDFYLI